MVDFTTKRIKEIEYKTHFIKDNIEKVLRLIDILEFIFTSKLKDKLVLKGGTAINIFYANMPILSVDIDLDYIGSTKEEMIADKNVINSFLKDELQKKGYNFSILSKRHYALDSLVFDYTNNANNKDVIKLDINYMDRSHILPIKSMFINLNFYKNNIGINVLNEHELFGSKLGALVNRAKPRDVYDVYNLIHQDVITDLNLLKKCFIFYNCLSGDINLIDYNSERIDALTKRDFFRMLRPMLSKEDKFDYSIAIKEVKEFIYGLLVFDNSEITFINEFNNKNYVASYLFNDSEIVDRIKNHPMALFRCK